MADRRVHADSARARNACNYVADHQGSDTSAGLPHAAGFMLLTLSSSGGYPVLGVPSVITIVLALLLDLFLLPNVLILADCGDPLEKNFPAASFTKTDSTLE